MKFVPLLAVLLLLVASGARAELSRAELSGVYVSVPSGAKLDLNFKARDVDSRIRSVGSILQGRPAFLSFVDYTCNTLCGTDLELVSAAIGRAQLSPRDYRFVVMGIDPKDSPHSAEAMERKEIPSALRDTAVFLLPDAATIAAATRALGFHYAYDAAIDQFAHPAVVYVIAPDGTVRAALSPFALATADLKKIIGGNSPAPTLYDRIRLLCYGYDAATGIYTLRVTTLLKAGAGITVVLVAGALFFLLRLGRIVS